MHFTTVALDSWRVYTYLSKPATSKFLALAARFSVCLSENCAQEREGEYQQSYSRHAKGTAALRISRMSNTALKRFYIYLPCYWRRQRPSVISSSCVFHPAFQFLNVRCEPGRPVPGRHAK